MKTGFSSTVFCLLLLWFATGSRRPADAQETTRSRGAVARVPVRVTASSGSSIYLDQGRAAGLRPGDEVVLRSPSLGMVHAVVQSVSSRSARCVVASGRRRIDIGTQGEVLIPRDRVAPETNAARLRAVPEHPQWTRPPENWDASQPLLAPAHSREPRERPTELHGRVFASYLHTWNRHASHDQYSLGRVGGSVWMENPFGQGGGLRVDGELNRRGVLLEDFFRDFHGPARIDRISYYWGGDTDRSWRWEVGRFISDGFPELGVVDGTEVSYRLAAGHSVGVNIGFLPEPFPSLVLGPDFHTSAYFLWVGGPDECVTCGVAYQKTWHRATPDRDLIIIRGDYNPSSVFSVHAAVWTDFYDHHDTLKNTFAEVTQALFQPLLRITPGSGLGLHMSYVRWPQLQRRDYLPLVQQQIIQDHVLRYGLFAWQELGMRVRLDGRVDQWRDQSRDEGTSWEARILLTDWVIPQGEIAVTVFGADGLYAWGPGGSIRFGRRFDWWYGSVAYDIADYALATTGVGLPTTSASGIVQQAIRLNFDFEVGTRTTISVFSDYRYGPGLSAFQGGIYLQKRL